MGMDGSKWKIMAYKLRFYKDVKSDYSKLDGSQKVFVDKGLQRITKLGMQCGQPLLGDLVGFRRLKNKRMGLRIIFGQGQQSIQIIDIVAIGKRSRNYVYELAGERIHNQER
jgi:mRNA interferase RelE/StbE